MKKTETDSHKKLASSVSIGSGNRTVGLTSNPRKKKKRSIGSIRKTTPAKVSRSGIRTSRTGGCSGCSRSAGNKK